MSRRTDSYAEHINFYHKNNLPEELDERFDMEGGIMAANGGRIGFAEGPKDLEELFKIMGGIMSLPFSKFRKAELLNP